MRECKQIGNSDLLVVLNLYYWFFIFRYSNELKIELKTFKKVYFCAKCNTKINLITTNCCGIYSKENILVRYMLSCATVRILYIF